MQDISYFLLFWGLFFSLALTPKLQAEHFSFL